MNETELLPCPFCGGEARTFQTATYCWSAMCNTPFCGCEFASYSTEAEAIAAWNTRATLGGGTCEDVGGNGDYFICSECGSRLDVTPYYCPNCGRRVKDETNG